MRHGPTGRTGKGAIVPMRSQARQNLFNSVVLAAFLAGCALKFGARGALRGSAYDVLLVLVLASATFSARHARLLKAGAGCGDAGEWRRRQARLNRSSVAAWAAIAVGAEGLQGVLSLATGRDVLGRFDPYDLACYAAGAALSLLVNRLLYRDIAAATVP